MKHVDFSPSEKPSVEHVRKNAPTAKDACPTRTERGLL